MQNFSLKKVFKKPEIKILLRQLEECCGEKLTIIDTDSHCLWGKNIACSQHKADIYCHEILVGAITGEIAEHSAQAIAIVLGYIVQTEYEKKQLAKDTLQKYEEVVFLSQFSNAIATCTSLNEVITVIRDEIRQVINVDEIFLYLYDQSQDKLTPFLYKTEESLRNLKAIENIIQRILEVNGVEVIDDVQDDHDYLNHPSDIRSLLCSSLTVQNSIIGVLGLAHYQTKYFDSTDLNLFSTITSQVAAAIRTAQYYETIKNYSQTLELRVRERTLELEFAKQQLEQVNQQLKHLAIYDELTQIPNRRYFTTYLEQEWRQCLRQKSPISLILCDVDYFKNYNDLYGHQVGDQCLQSIAKIVQSALKRPSDVLARYGGEEFILILPYTDQPGAYTVAERIHCYLAEAQISHADSPTSRYVTVSLGIGTTVPLLHYQPSDLIKIADQALYAAKASGRNQTRGKVLSFQCG
ncbi:MULTISPECIES: sensor domain-containing diguanylate cyclase [unclassified Synechocystis]|uniref:sensor domain-containing diguanylate cyclase n=1 Tax=unclassified Synechocystis TaxID=2640012 RepID=UPI000428F233|nr:MULTISPECIES: sensor domain-containing diguanylate cyclase [unclassified Synechocystis]AIE74362.1 Two-component response regulator [Synechocystis sp. PCC 6714]MCT0254862.1 diguanylate cyclase [Synechocystis sp. CS-94]